MALEGREFLTRVWGQQPAGYFFLAVKSFNSGKFKQFGQMCTQADRGRIRLPVGNGGLPANLYFCPHAFQSDVRRNQSEGGKPSPTCWFHADLDETDPEGLDLVPTIAWETSPGRFQALWEISSSRLDQSDFERINRALNYHILADKNGWSITKYLRVPGSYNSKYASEGGHPHRVEPLWDDGPAYSAQAVWDQVKGADRGIGGMSSSHQSAVIPQLDTKAIVAKYKLSSPVKQLINAKFSRVGERSEKMWLIECALLEAGATPEETVAVVAGTAWNKWSGRRNEAYQIWREVEKAQRYVGERRVEAAKNGHRRGLRLRSFTAFMAEDRSHGPNWMVDGIWSVNAHGMVAGEPKTYKSLISMDLGVSVASGTEFLGKYPVPEKGPVLLIQRENDERIVWDRFNKIASARGLQGSATIRGRTMELENMGSLPIHVLPRDEPFMLDDEKDFKMLIETVEDIKPKLVILDPLYMMVRRMDENDASSVRPVLQTLMEVKRNYNTGILLVHHFNKPREGEDRRRGHRISGSSVFYRWVESILYLENGREFGEVVITPEHRSHPSGTSIRVKIDMGDFGDDEYELDVEMTQSSAVSLKQALRELVQENPGVTVAEAVRLLNVSSERLNRQAEKLGLRKLKGKADGTPGRPSPRLFMPVE